jgi:hypothetical protein
MTTKIRVFIGSTMKDLANERHEVVSRVSGFNFEPVNAEGWLPQGTRVWERIEKEIESCHLFVLILGDSYGWIPPRGPGASEGLSVTHMEARKAREAGLPILPFLKRLDYESPRDTDDARRRDAFRAEVSDWAAGGVIAEFELAAKVGAALVEVLSEGYLAAEVRSRAETASAAQSEVKAEELKAEEAEPEPLSIPASLVEYVVGQNSVLIAGAGISMAAGYPSARAMTEVVSSQLRQQLKDPGLNLSGMPFQEIAGNLEAAFGRPYLLDIFLRAMSGPQGIKPTEAHLLGVRLFKRIITTNFDTLFEAACDAQGIDYMVMEPFHPLVERPGATIIFKLSGSLTRPESLLITERDVWDVYEDSVEFRHRLFETVSQLPALVVGSSLRDTAIKMILSDVKGLIEGYIVSPYMNPFERLQYERFRLRPIETTADAFFLALDRAVALHRQANPKP